jgi:hypothetical protein
MNIATGILLSADLEANLGRMAEARGADARTVVGALAAVFARAAGRAAEHPHDLVHSRAAMEMDMDRMFIAALSGFDVLKRACAVADVGGTLTYLPQPMATSAALAETEALRARVAQLQAALEPFATAYDGEIKGDDPGHSGFCPPYVEEFAWVVAHAAHGKYDPEPTGEPRAEPV